MRKRLGRSRRRHCLVGLSVSTALLGGLLVTTNVTSGAAASTFVSTSVQEAPDYASTVFHDAWDYSNPSDVILDKGPTTNVTSASMSKGVLAYTAGPGSYISPLWGGYPGSMRIGRDGSAAGNQLSAATYTRMHLHAYASSNTGAALFYFIGDGLKTLGGVPFTLKAGWNDYDLLMQNKFPGRAGYSGSITGLRLATSPHSPTRIGIDFLRVYHVASASTLTWRSPSGRPATLHWSSDSSSPTGANSTSGVVTGTAGTASTVGSSGTASVNVSGYPAGTRFYAVDSSGQPVGTSLRITNRPVVTVISPDASGCGDWATSALGHPWTFTSSGSIAGTVNARSISFAKGVLSATNARPTINDPHVLFKVGKGINGTIWNRLTLVTGYDGSFNLADTAGGGTMGRIMWKLAGKSGISQTNDLLTYSGKRTIVVNMAQPTSTLTENTASIRYPFASGRRVSELRWDPNEDRGARRWHVYSIRLARDCTATSSFAVRWQDKGVQAGAVATVLAVQGSKSYNLGAVTEKSGVNSLAANTRSLPAGRYTIRVSVTNGGNASASLSGSPLVVSH
ncbi:hypothetical protein M6D93_16060 [Jatrophihabitans telluris]|uniref:Uncharacterized protein n=1 Tax=Jatrophihabitans telluris TaxID=2038343 RepID=A0ABY4QX82_9ACTN|nr:hypothetical protein [Jatrophihabitans telluris]UQX87802.1 hypothetical protein M6D93_16060 [Jatrophihabitans telluris]